MVDVVDVGADEQPRTRRRRPRTDANPDVGAAEKPWLETIRAAAIVQLLLGNIGPPGRRDPGPARPREHPGLDRYPDALQHPAGVHPDAPPAVHPSLEKFVELNGPDTGAWGN